MDLYARLIHDHDKARRLVSRLVERPERPRTEELREALTTFKELSETLQAHFAAEERVVYRSFRRFPELRAPVLKSVEEHKLAGRLLRELALLGLDDERWRAKFALLNDLLEREMEEEEQTIFPEAKALLDARKAEELASRFDQVEGKIAA